MAEGRLHRILSAVVKIKPGEARLVLFLFWYFFLITAPFNIIKSLRDASYLEDLGPNFLPYAYASALLVGLAVSLHARLQAKLSRRGLLRSTLVFFVLLDLAFWAIFSTSDWKWWTLLYWMWANVFVVVLTTQFWILVNDVFNPREAKRLIGFLGSGGILGGVAGGVLTGFAARWMNAHDLLLLSAVFLLGALAVVSALFAGRSAAISPAGESPRSDGPPPSAGPSKIGFWDCARSVRKSRYLMLIGAVVMATGIVSTFIDWQSKTIIYQAGRANLTSFFGFFNSGLLAFAFLFQLVLTSRFIERFGIRLGLMIYPAVLFFMSLGIAVRPDLLFAVGIKGSDKALSYSLNQSARELLYIPVVPELKYRAKIFIDMFLNRFSKAVGGLVLIVLFLLSAGKIVALSDLETGRVLTAVSAVSAVFIVLWMVLNTLLDRAYVREVRLQLAKKWERPDTLVSERMDVETAKLIVDALESRTQSPTLFALHLYDLARRRKLTPEIKSLLAPPPAELSPSLSSPLMESGEAIWMPDADDPALSAEMDAEIREILALDSYQKLMGEYAGRILDGPARSAGGSETARMELAKAIGLMGRALPLAGRLGDLLGDPSPAVFQFAAESAGRLRDREFVALLVRRLADPMSRGDARAALEKYGESIVGTLADFLADHEEGGGVRGPVASLLAGIGTSEAAGALLEELARGPSGLEEDIIDALDRIRSRNPELAFPGDAVRARLASVLAAAGPVSGAADLLPVFRLLGLIHDHEDIFRAYQNLLKGTKDSIGYAIELLDHTLDPETKSRLFPRLDDLAGGGAAPAGA
jgi:ATP:ADP antiporter, AAA family